MLCIVFLLLHVGNKVQSRVVTFSGWCLCESLIPAAGVGHCVPQHLWKLRTLGGYQTLAALLGSVWVIVIL